MAVKHFDVFDNDANVLYSTDYRLTIYYNVSRTSAEEASVTVKAGVSLHDWGSNGSGYPGFSSSYSYDQTVRCDGESHTESVNPTTLNSDWNTLYVNNGSSLPIVKYLVSKTFEVTGLSALNSKEISIGGSIQCARATNWSPGYGTTDFNITIPAYAGSVLAGSVSITDNGDNTYTISSTTGSSGTNNYAGNCHIYYTTDGSEPSSSNGSGINTGKADGQTYSTVLNVSSKKTIKAIAYTIGTYNNAASSVASESVKYYHAPTVRPTPQLSFNTKKPTLKSNFTITWSAATQYGSATYNAVKGYRLRVIKNDSVGLNFNSGCTNESGDIYLEKSSAGSVSFNASNITNNTLAVNDRLDVRLHVWSTNGKGDRLYYDSSNPAKSNSITIVNMGIVWLRIGNNWVEGQVWSRYGSTWDECTGLFIRDSSTWKESTS